MTTVGGMQRGVTLDQAVAQGAPGTVAAGIGLGFVGTGVAVGVGGLGAECSGNMLSGGREKQRYMQ